MSFDEKSAWAFMIALVSTSLVYIAIIARRLMDTPAIEVAYVSALIWTIGISITITVVAGIVISISKPFEADRRDERDRRINQLGEYVGGTTTAALMMVPFGLTLAGLDHFWIANSMYAAFATGGLLGAITKTVTYRRGF